MNLCRHLFGRNAPAFLRSAQRVFYIQKEGNSSRIVNCNGMNVFYHYSTDSRVPSPKKPSNQKSSKLMVKTAKGTCDHGPQEMELRQRVFGKIESIFKTHGAQTIDTPIFELKELLTGKYGDDTKLIYDLADQGGEILSLRYDLTVPLARYLAMNKISSIKRYHIGKVYRRDTPSKAQGRLREFYQCDFDIVGPHDAMLPEVECIKVMSEVFNSLDIGEFVIKVNHRLLLNGLFEACGVPEDKFKSICSAIDKLDKLSWADVRKEMIEEKGLSESVADNIGKYTQQCGNVELIDRLLSDEFLNKTSASVKGLEELKLLLKYCNLLGLQNSVVFDLSLARGLDYYTGAIFEAVLKDKNVGDVQQSIGSIAAGGRYDDLMGVFDAKGRSEPCVGVSIGVERIFAVLESKVAKEGIKPANSTDVYVMSAHKGLHEQRLQIVNRLWTAGIRSEHSYKENPKLVRQLEYSLKHGIPYAIIIGDSELQRNVFKLRTFATHEEIEIPISDLENEIRKRVNKTEK
ncbi:histidine--tRNA ligase, cytoplasmic-like [Contarinia nasturtii]|uniref:histidine--tRNA ligase, cytoplasmic-like n=1 Tax=Contarinia nasturtii TaxID=265458 RepID=UPI0012D4B519|nr:histidine--tRNA ligase, cytoplasmic-like [Contarinia nasturtii]